MEIYPENLGPEVSAAVQKERNLRESNELADPFMMIVGVLLFVLLSVTAIVGLLGLVATGTAEAGLGWLGLVAIVPVMLLTWRLLMSAAKAGKMPVSSLVSLAPAELHALSALQNDPLLHNYLELTTDVLQTDVPDRDAQREIRAALQTLGTTVASLPAEEPRAESDDPARLHAEAARLSAEADAEPDAVIGASLRRRAESQARRADTAAKTSLLLRRNQALRQETAEQMEALKTSLTAFRVGGQPSVPELADLAAGIQRVAREANAITEARAEVGTLLATPGRLREDTEPIQRQSIGR